MRNFAAYSGIWCFLTVAVIADEPSEAPAVESFSPSQRVMIVNDQTHLYVGENPNVNGLVPSGSVLRFTNRSSNRLYVPAKDAWVLQEQVIPIEQANAYFTNLINAEPTAEAFHHRGIARHAMAYFDLAMEDFDEAIRLGLKSSALYVNRGITWQSLNNSRHALDDITRAVEIDPENALAYNNRCLIWASLGKLDRALADATRAIRLDPNYAEAFLNRGVTKVKQGAHASAVEDYNEALSLRPDYAEALANRGFAQKKLADYRAALEDYRRAVLLAPRRPQAFNDAAWLIATCPEESIRDGQRAVEYARHACELTEFKNGDYVDTLAAAYAEAGQFSEAVKVQQQALTLLPEGSHEAARQRLERYSNQQPYHEIPK